jgi:hypothetical protein
MRSKPLSRPRAFKRSSCLGAITRFPRALHFSDPGDAYRLRSRQQKHGWFHDVQYTHREWGFSWLEFSLRRLRGVVVYTRKLVRLPSFVSHVDRPKAATVSNPSPIHQHTNKYFFNPTSYRISSISHEYTMTISRHLCSLFGTVTRGLAFLAFRPISHLLALLFGSFFVLHAEVFRLSLFLGRYLL